MKLFTFALLLFLANPAQAAKIISEVRLDLNGDEQPDLVRIVDYGRKGNSLEIYFAGKARPFSFDRIVKNSRSFPSEGPLSTDYEVKLEKLSETSFRINGMAYSHTNRSTRSEQIDFSMRENTLDLDYYSEHWQLSTGDERAHHTARYDFVKRTAFHSSENIEIGQKLEEKEREIPAGCQPQLADLNSSGIPYCARF